jgi:hypothetical protein
LEEQREHILSISSFLYNTVLSLWLRRAALFLLWQKYLTVSCDCVWVSLEENACPAKSRESNTVKKKIGQLGRAHVQSHL